MGTINVYRTYAFKDKDPVIDKLRTVIKDEKVSYKDIHEASGVTVSCLRNWFEGKTRRPQHPTVMAVVHALGYEYLLRKKRGKKK